MYLSNPSLYSVPVRYFNQIVAYGFVTFFSPLLIEDRFASGGMYETERAQSLVHCSKLPEDIHSLLAFLDLDRQWSLEHLKLTGPSRWLLE